MSRSHAGWRVWWENGSREGLRSAQPMGRVSTGGVRGGWVGCPEDQRRVVLPKEAWAAVLDRGNRHRGAGLAGWSVST